MMLKFALPRCRGTLKPEPGLGRKGHTGTNRMTDMPNRDDILRTGITKNHKIIEIGPSYNPLTPKAEGWRSYVVDHADRAGLIEKYRKDPSFNIAKIEEVAFVWTEGPLAASVSSEHHGPFDIFIACHVLEHVPDLIGTL